MYTCEYERKSVRFWPVRSQSIDITCWTVFSSFWISLFNGISTYVGYLMSKPFS